MTLYFICTSSACESHFSVEPTNHYGLIAPSQFKLAINRTRSTARTNAVSSSMNLGCTMNGRNRCKPVHGRHLIELNAEPRWCNRPNVCEIRSEIMTTKKQLETIKCKASSVCICHGQGHTDSAWTWTNITG